MRDLSLTHKMSVILGIVLLVSVIASVCIFMGTLNLRSSVDYTREVDAISVSIGSMESKMRHARQDMQNFLLSGDVKDRNAYNQRKEELDALSNINVSEEFDLLPEHVQGEVINIINIFEKWRSEIVDEQL